MKRFGWWFAGLAVLLALGLSTSAARADGTPAHKFVGADKCKMCHNSPAKGEQYTKWAASKHAHAFETLGTEEAKKVGATKGVTDPQKDPKCLKCHVTGYGSPAEMLTDKYNAQQGVSCESCHGAGGDYWNMAVMKDHAKAVGAGLVMPNEATCTQCHNPENPTHKGFDFAAYSAKIAHPNPQKGAAK
jgi:hypothetical protein